MKGVPLARPERGAPPSGPLGLIERGMRSLQAHLLDPSGALNIDGLDVTVRALAMAVIVLLNLVTGMSVAGASDGSLSVWIVAGLIIYNTSVIALLGVPFKRAPGFILLVVDWLVGSSAIIATGGIFSPFIVLYYALAIGAALRVGFHRSLMLVGGCGVVLVALTLVTPVSPGLGLPIVAVEITSLVMAVITTVGMRHAVEVETQRVVIGEREALQLRRLNEYTQAVLSASPDLPRALEAVAIATRLSVGADRALAVLTNQSRQDSTSGDLVMSTDGYPVPPHLSSQEVDLLARATSSLAPVVAANVPGMVCTPLVIGTEVLGAVFVYFERYGRVGASELALVGTIGRHMALAIRLAHLYDLERVRALRSEESERIERDLLTVVSHELRTPLTAMKTVVGALATRAHTPDFSDRPERIDDRLILNLERTTDRLAMLTDDLLDMAHLRAGRVVLQMQPINVADLITESVDLARPLLKEREQSISLDLPSQMSRRHDLLFVHGDRRRLEQVILNLLSNAVKYSPKGSTILIGATARGGQARVFVRDEGPGVDPLDEHLIFEKFYQGDMEHRVDNRQRQGLGLGLSIARAVVELHGGCIGVTSAAGKGSTFYFTLPLHNSREEVGAESDSK